MTTSLHAASREALTAAELKLVEIADAATDPAQLGTLGDELFAVVGLLNGQPTLRRTLADASTDPAGRERLLRGLLGGKVADQTLDLLTTVVTARWSSPRELLDGTELLARTALLAQAERQGRLDAVEDELFRLGRILTAQPELESLLSNQAGDPRGKLDLVHSLISPKVEPVTAALVEQLVTNPRGLSVVPGVEELAALAARRRERSVAHVRSAAELTAAQLDRLGQILTRIYSRPIALHVEIDPELIGGLVIRIGDEVIDGSALGRLAEARRELAG
jgi:F-type H+-transporting ATPase subunit delta